MIRKCFYFILFIQSCFATSTMAGIEKEDYFDNDNILDRLVCSKDNNSNYECILNYDNKFKIITVKNNNNCSDYSIENISKGEIKIQCSVWGINKSYYYKFDKDNWYLNKYVYEELPMNGPDDKSKYLTIDFSSNKWTIENKIEDIKFEITVNKQILYSAPNKNSKMKMYLIKGNKIDIIEEQDKWIKILFHGKKDIEVWIPKSAVE